MMFMCVCVCMCVMCMCVRASAMDRYSIAEKLGIACVCASPCLVYREPPPGFEQVESRNQ